MENFEYSIQLSDKDWANFSEAAEECGLLQAALASGDEPLSSDIDQGDSSGSSPPGPPPPRLLRLQAGSPPPEGLLKALGGRCLPGHLATAQGGCSGSEEEEGTDARLVSRFRCERVLAPEAGQQTPSTSTQLEGQLPSSVLCPAQLTPALSPKPSSCGGAMQKSLQGAAAQASEAGVHSGKDPPSQGPSGQEQPSSLGPADGKRSPRDPNPGVSPRSPGKKKRRSVGAKGSGSPKAQDSKRQGPPSPLLALPPSSGSRPDRGPSTRAHSNLAPADWEGNGPGSESPAGGAGLGTRAGHGTDPQDPSSTPDLGPKPTPPAPQEQSFLDLSSPVSKTETPVNVSTPTWIPGAGENLSTPVSLPEKASNLPGVASEVGPSGNLSTPVSLPEKALNLPGVASEIGPSGNLSTPVSLPEKASNLPGVASEVGPSGNLSTPVSKDKLREHVFTSDIKTNSGVGVSTPIPKLEPERHRSALFLLAKADVGPATLVPRAQTNVNMSTPAPQVQSDVKLSTPDLKAEPDRNLSTSAPRARADVDVSTPDLKAEPDRNLSTSAPKTRADVDVSTPPQITKSFNFPVSPQGLHGEPEEGSRTPLSPGPLGEPSQVTDDATQSPGVVTPARAPRRKKVRFSGVSTSPQENSDLASPSSALPNRAVCEPPRTLGGGRGSPRAWDAVAVGVHPQPRILKPPPSPSALARESAGPREDFALTLPEAYDYFFCDTIVEEEEEEEEDIPSDVQWPEVCEYFFWDSRLPRQRPSPGPPLQAPTCVDPVPISIPEAYEHFFGEEGPTGVLLPPNWVPVTLSDEQTLGPERAWPSAPALEEQNLLKAEELGLPVSLEEEQRASLIPITFNQNDMCLGFVAFATWAVRTSDLHAPDAWKTVLLANIGAISAIRYFRRQARKGRPCP
ncbi:PGC-1 and ERR-induced regulator in muscle protein 1 [Phascolarctos cinereus]|uniref:PGC-1 and ERR-induced regulator in muscle protein 1 n=1 Tax=Phascolarctos cinereus TaxID=38626 RepID=A0A6P5JN50_PHACI|nr:PGC-1 and ERR-induced regulator in muscle protein 1 [Phascolarctos cinereus]XP_020832462.1 PGC-1 and ERR-induced regulator in muscle protein 1 [Phascolarctos cinereus]